MRQEGEKNGEERKRRKKGGCKREGLREGEGESEKLKHVAILNSHPAC